MKKFIKELIVILYFAFSISTLMLAIVYPFALSFNDGPPLWTCWILYPTAILIMSSQSQILNWINKK